MERARQKDTEGDNVILVKTNRGAHHTYRNRPGKSGDILHTIRAQDLLFCRTSPLYLKQMVPLIDKIYFWSCFNLSFLPLLLSGGFRDSLKHLALIGQRRFFGGH